MSRIIKKMAPERTNRVKYRTRMHGAQALYHQGDYLGAYASLREAYGYADAIAHNREGEEREKWMNKMLWALSCCDFLRTRLKVSSL